MKRRSHFPNGRIAPTLFLGIAVALATISGCGRQEAEPLPPKATVVKEVQAILRAMEAEPSHEEFIVQAKVQAILRAMEAEPLAPAATVVTAAAPDSRMSAVDFQDKRYRQTATNDDFTGDEVD